MAVGQTVALLMVNKCVKFEVNSFDGIHESYGWNSTFSKCVNGHKFVKMPDRVMAFGQIVALKMMKKCVKFEDNSLNGIEVFGKIQYFSSP